MKCKGRGVNESSDLMKLYSKRILALAANLPHTERLATPDATARRRSPLCGSTVTVDLALADGKIVGFGQDVKACALGQAAASVIGQNVIGCTPEQVAAGQVQLHEMLTAGGPPPGPPFADLEALLPARDYKNRHASIMLTFDAILEALSTRD